MSDAELNTIIENAISTISVAYYWPFAKITTNITTVVGQQAYALPTDFESGDKLVNTTEDLTVPFISATQALDVTGDDDTQTTNAQAFWIRGSNLYLYPLPSAAVANKYRLYYFRKVTQFADDVTDAEWNAAFHPLLVDFCNWKLWEREEYFEQANAAKGEFYSGLQDMILFYSNQFKVFPNIIGDGTYRRYRNPNMPFLDIV